MIMSTHLAIDIGGSHGRGVLGIYDGTRSRAIDIGSFSTAPAWIHGQLSWDIDRMFSGICQVLKQAAEITARIDTIAIDTMGLSFALLDRSGKLLCPAVYTRTPQDEALKSEILSFFGREHLYSINGLEQQKLNSLYYLAKAKKEQPDLLRQTAHFLMLPDLFNYLLTGVMTNEYTIATTSGLWDISHSCWSPEILDFIGLESHMFSDIINCSEKIGKLRPELSSGKALRDTVVVSAAAHDTASAFFGLSEKNSEQLLISAGTWGMLGCILEKPILTVSALDSLFANEGAALNKIKFLNNAPNMSILNDCMSFWNAGGQICDWAFLFQQAEMSKDISSTIDLYNPDFRSSENVPEKIKLYCRNTGQAVPETIGEITSVVIASIASHYGKAFNALKRLTKRTFDCAILVGGSGRNKHFIRECQRELGIPIHVDSTEASVKGNLKAQYLAFNKHP